MIVMLHAADQRPQKQLRNFKAVNRAPLDRAMNFRVVRFATEKLQRLRTDREHFRGCIYELPKWKVRSKRCLARA
jgi:hypothetical protein